MAKITTKRRNALKKGQFALPSDRKYPIDTAGRTRNAAARLSQQRDAGNVSEADFKTAKAAIARAAKRFGIDSTFAPSKGS